MDESQVWRSTRPKKVPSRYTDDVNDLNKSTDVNNTSEKLKCDSGICVTLMLSEDDQIKCSRCGRCYCTVCSDVTRESLKSINDVKGSLWFCTTCLNPAMQAISTDIEIEEKCNEYLSSIINRLEILEENYTKLEQDLTSKVDTTNITNKISQLQVQLNEQKLRIDACENVVNNDIQASVTQEKPLVQNSNKDVILQITEAVNDNLCREKNIIIFNLNESTDNDRKERDKTIVTNLVDFLCERKDVKFKCSRLGNVDKQSSDNDNQTVPVEMPKHRPLKVEFASINIKSNIMSNCKKLGNEDCPQDLQSIGVAHDMSVEERKKDKELLTQANEMNRTQSDVPKNFIYKVRGPPWNRKIVKIKFKQAITQENH